MNLIIFLEFKLNDIDVSNVDLYLMHKQTTVNNTMPNFVHQFISAGYIVSWKTAKYSKKYVHTKL